MTGLRTSVLPFLLLYRAGQFPRVGSVLLLCDGLTRGGCVCIVHDPVFLLVVPFPTSPSRVRVDLLLPRLFERSPCTLLRTPHPSIRLFPLPTSVGSRAPYALRGRFSPLSLLSGGSDLSTSPCPCSRNTWGTSSWVFHGRWRVLLRCRVRPSLPVGLGRRQ